MHEFVQQETKNQQGNWLKYEPYNKQKSSRPFTQNQTKCQHFNDEIIIRTVKK